jgi:hypothetical protein
MTMESSHHESHPSADVVRSSAPSAGSWREIVERLDEVEQDHAKLAEAIEVVDLMVQDALTSEARASLGSPSIGVPPEQGVTAAGLFASPAPGAEPGAGPGHVSDPFAGPGGDGGVGFKDSAGPAENLKTSVEASARPAWSGASEVPEPAVETGVPEPVFYVPSYDEKVLPATSVAELTASALDAVLASEFGPSTAGAAPVAAPPDTRPINNPELSVPTPPRVEASHAPESVFERVSTDVGSPAPRPSISTAPSPSMAPAPSPSMAAAPSRSISSAPSPSIEHSKVLDILLGVPRATENAQSRTDMSAASGTTASNASSPPPVAPAPEAESVIVMASPPPPPPPPVSTDTAPPPPPPVFTDTHTAPPPRPPSVFSEGPAPTAVFTPEPDTFAVTPDDPVPPAFEHETTPPPPSPVFTTQEPTHVATPPLPAPPPPMAPPAPMAPTGPVGFSFSEAPAPPVTTPSSPPAAPVFEAPPAHINGIEPMAAFEDEEEGAVFTTDPSNHLASAASMATEILSATPEVEAVFVTDEDLKSELISPDVTLIARGRRKRFRLR